MGLLETIKRASLDAQSASNPVIIQYGEVKSINPLSVKVDQRFTLTTDFLIVPECLTRLEINLQHNHTYAEGITDSALNYPIVIREGLKVTDKVILLRMQGGQKYLILDKVVSS